MKNIIKQKLEAMTKLILAISIFVTSFGYIPFVSAQDYTKGDIIDPTNSVGEVEQEGGVALEKTISKTDEEGVYTVTLKVKGKDKVITESQTGSIYTTVVLDTSGSMENYCDGYSLFGECYGTIVKKYDNAIDGAKTFATNLLSKYESSQIALVTFAYNVHLTRDFANKDFSDVRFPYADGGTNLGAAIQKAADLLVAKKNNDSNSKLYMVVLSDGYPEAQTVNHTSAANYAKSQGIEIFTIGYDTTRETEELLKGVATDASHFKKADTSNIADMFDDVLGDIKIPLNAGTNATITDVVADGFTYVEGSASSNAAVDGKNISFNIGNITEDGTTVSFKIKTEKDLEDGIHRTNDLAKVEYTDIENNSAKLEITDSSKIYWEQDKYTYTVNYKEEGTDKVLSDSKVVNDAVYGRNYAEDALKITGYNVVGESTKNILVDENNKEITFYYTKKNDLTYTVEYYIDNLNNKLGLENFGNQTFGDTIEANEIDVNKHLEDGYQDGVIITTMPYTIIDGENIIQVLYQKRENITYSVNYLDKDTNESILDSEIRTNKKYLETYTETAKEAPFGYRLVSDETQEVLVNEDNKVVTFYYEKRDDMKYTVNYKEQDTEKVLVDSKVVTDAVYNETYAETAKEITGYNVVGSTKQEVLVDEDNKEIIFYYTKREDMKYTVNYKEQDTEKVLADSKVVTDAVYNEIYTETALDITGYRLVGDSNQEVLLDADDKTITFYYEKRDDMKYTVNYKEEGTDKVLSESKVVNDAVYNETYTETAKEITGYNVVGNATQNVLISEDNQEITFYYTKKTDLTYIVEYYLDNLSNKLGFEKFDNQTFGDTVEANEIDVNKYLESGYQDGVFITDMPYTIIDGENIIQVLYQKREDMTYSVNYLDKDTNESIIESEIKTDKRYLETYIETAKEAPFGYRLVSDKTQEVLVNEDNKVVTFYYEKRDDMKYTVNYKEEGTEKVLSDSKVVNDAVYSEVYTEVALEITGYNVVGESTQEVLVDKDNKEITFYYTKREDMKYTVNYKEEGTEKVLSDSKVVNDAVYSEVYTEVALEITGYNVVGESTQEVLVDKDNKVVTFYYEKREDMKYTVNYKEEGTNKILANSKVVNDAVYSETYTEDALEITGYNVVGESTQEVLVDKDNKEITFYYTKKNDLSYIVEYYLDGTKISNDLDNTFDGKTFEEVINSEDIDVNKYLKKGYKDGVFITEMPYTITDGENIIQISYTKKDDLTYRVEYYYDGVLDKSKTDYFENLTYGTEISEYEDKNIEGYIFVKDTGVLVIDDEIDNVIKVYYEQENPGIGSGCEDDIQPPNTGVDTTSPLYLLFLLPVALFISFRRSTKLEK